MVSKQTILDHYGKAANGQHRDNSESFLQMEAEEKLFHLKSGESLFDFGCGSADLLVYYSKNFKSLLGLDISENMIRLAKARIERFGCRNIEVGVGDETSVWDQCHGKRFNVITSAGVVQYLDEKQIAGFLDSAIEFLDSNGRIVLFDIVDPRIYRMICLGLYRPTPLRLFDYLGVAYKTAKYFAKETLKRLELFQDPMGYTHHPGRVIDICESKGLNVSIVKSMYYEYRYHAIIALQ